MKESIGFFALGGIFLALAVSSGSALWWIASALLILSFLHNYRPDVIFYAKHKIYTLFEKSKPSLRKISQSSSFVEASPPTPGPPDNATPASPAPLQVSERLEIDEKLKEQINEMLRIGIEDALRQKQEEEAMLAIQEAKLADDVKRHLEDIDEGKDQHEKELKEETSNFQTEVLNEVRMHQAMSDRGLKEVREDTKEKIQALRESLEKKLKEMSFLVNKRILDITNPMKERIESLREQGQSAEADPSEDLRERVSDLERRTKEIQPDERDSSIEGAILDLRSELSKLAVDVKLLSHQFSHNRMAIVEEEKSTKTGMGSISRGCERAQQQAKLRLSVLKPFIGIIIHTGLTLTKSGVPIASVVTGSPAAEAGLVQGDIIEKLDGEQAQNSRLVMHALRDKRPGDKISMKIRRGFEEKDIELSVGTPDVSKQELNVLIRHAKGDFSNGTPLNVSPTYSRAVRNFRRFEFLKHRQSRDGKL